MVLTAGLAAGQAGATEVSGAGQLSGSGTVRVESSDKFTVTVSGSNSFNADVVINGLSEDGYIGFSGGGETGNASLSGAGSLIINGTGTSTFVIGPSGSNVGSGTLSINTIAINGGKVEIQSVSGDTVSGDITVAANEIDVSGSGSTLTLYSSGTDTFVTLGASGTESTSGSKITISDGAELTISGSNTTNIYGEYLDFYNATLSVADGASLNIGTEGGTWSGSTANVSGTITIDLADSDYNSSISGSKNESVLTIASGSKVNLQTASSKIEITAGTLKVEGSLVADESGASVVVNGQSSTAGQVSGSYNSTLVISSETLEGFLKSGNDSMGGLVLTSGGVLEFSDDEDSIVDLYDFTWSGDSSAVSGAIALGTSGGIVRGINLAVSAKLENASGNNLYIEADRLTLGSDSYTGSESLGFEQATVKDTLTFEASVTGNEFPTI